MKYVDFNSVKIRNFLSIGQEPVEISFRQGLNVITGVNKDKEDRRNGVGKSTIADAIHFAIFGETIRELSKEFIVNSINKKNTYVELKFQVNENNTTKDYRIVRKLKPTKCYLYVNDIDLTESTIPNTNKRIKNILNSSPEVFQNCVIMSLNTTLPFMAQRKVEKRKFIEGILNLEIFSEMLLLFHNSAHIFQFLQTVPGMRTECTRIVRTAYPRRLPEVDRISQSPTASPDF